MTGLGDIGEFGLIARLARCVGAGAQVAVGMGDDCAVLNVGAERLLVSCDLSIEDVHFRRCTAEPYEIGWKAGAAAWSDIAAMGGAPLGCVVALAAPPETETALLEGVFEGLDAAARSVGAAVAGGDTARSRAGIVLDVTVLGRMAGGRCVLRSGAQPGDVLAVVGAPGLSAAGFHALEHGFEAPVLTRAHLLPVPRIAEGQWLAGRDAVHAMIDTSDGLVQDARHLAEASGLGLEIEADRAPIAPELAAYCAQHGLDVHRLALTGGEDYGLACAVAADAFDSAAAGFAADTGQPLTAVGRFTGEHGQVRVDGAAYGAGGFDHFRAKGGAGNAGGLS